MGQSSETETGARDLRAELLQAEAAHFARKQGIPLEDGKPEVPIAEPSPKRLLENGSEDATEDEDNGDSKRRKLLEETREIDADSDGSESDSSEEERLVPIFMPSPSDI